MPQINIQILSARDTQVAALIAFHMQDMDNISPPGTSYSLDAAGLSAPNVTLFGMYSPEARLTAMVALKQMTPDTAEIKSMRTHPDFLRQGLGGQLLAHTITESRRRNYHSLYLETGTDAPFEASVKLYKKHGFVPTGVFGEYRPNPANQFFVLNLT